MDRSDTSTSDSKRSQLLLADGEKAAGAPADQTPERGNWDSKLEYLLSSIGYAVGLGNVWRFPYLCYKNGGGAFLVPYLIVLFVCGLPIFLLESSIGQFSSQGPVRAFNGMPVFKGLGFAMLAVSTFVAIYYNVILSWGLFYLWQGLKGLTGDGLPWATCVQNDTMYENCYSREQVKLCQGYQTANDIGSFDKECKNFDTRQMSVEIYYEKKVLGLERPTHVPGRNESTLDLSSLGSPQGHLVLTLFLSWIVIGLSIIKGVKSSGKTMYVTATFPYLVLTTLLIKGLTLEGAMKGISFFIKPVPSKLIEPKIWKDAVTQIFYSLSVSWGGLLTLSSYNPFRNNVYRDTYIVVCANSATSIYAGFAIFSFMGYMATSLGVEIEDVVSSGPGLAFIVWPEAMTKLSDTAWVCAIFTIIFFAMLYSLGISTMIVTVETIATSFMDIFPTMRNRRPQVVAVLITVFFLLALPLVCNKGQYWFTIFDDYCASYSVIVSAISEMLAISWVYGLDRVDNDIRMMTGKTLPKAFRVLWAYITPTVLIVTLLCNVVMHKSPSVEYFKTKYVFPANSGILSLFLVLTPIALMVGLAIRELKTHNWDWAKAKKPTNHWGPLHDSDRKAHGEERMDTVAYYAHAEVEAQKLKSGLYA